MTKATLEEILKKHALYLAGDPMGSQANLRGADLRYANLRDANLSRAYLSGADLSAADLRDANLSDANLCGANLSDAYLRGADLSAADLRDANLCGANLSGANLRGADLSRADLSGVTYSGNSIFLNTNGVNILTATFGKHQVVSIDANAGVGCHFYPLDFWVSNYDRIGEKAGYTPDEIRVYGNILKFFYETRNAQKGKS